MKSQKERTRRKPTFGTRRRLPKNFVCIAPDEGKHVIAFITGSAHEHEEIAKLHFHLCLHCQEKVARLPLLEATSKNRKELLHPSSHSGSLMKSSGLNNANVVRGEDHPLPTEVKKLRMKAAGEI